MKRIRTTLPQMSLSPRHPHIELWLLLASLIREHTHTHLLEYRGDRPCLFIRSVVAERRKQAIVESKFLGGDIQHTHLVKGLDYVLLDKASSGPCVNVGGTCHFMVINK